jgi:hypothetical protein
MDTVPPRYPDAPPDRCPTCLGPMKDLRGVGFNAEQMDRAGVCYRFGEDIYRCVVERRG